MPQFNVMNSMRSRGVMPAGDPIGFHLPGSPSGLGPIVSGTSASGWPTTVTDSTGATVPGATYNTWGYPIDASGNPLFTYPPATGAAPGPDGQAWVDPDTGKLYSPSGVLITLAAGTFPSAVVGDDGDVIAGATYNTWGYPMYSDGEPILTASPAPGAALGPQGQAWVDPTTGQNLDASGHVIVTSTSPWPEHVLDSSGNLVVGASYNTWGYPVDTDGNPLTSDPPASGAAPGPQGQAWLVPMTGQMLGPNGLPLAGSTAANTVATASGSCADAYSAWLAAGNLPTSAGNAAFLASNPSCSALFSPAPVQAPAPVAVPSSVIVQTAAATPSTTAQVQSFLGSITLGEGIAIAAVAGLAAWFLL